MQHGLSMVIICDISKLLQSTDTKANCKFIQWKFITALHLQDIFL